MYYKGHNSSNRIMILRCIIMKMVLEELIIVDINCNLIWWINNILEMIKMYTMIKNMDYMKTLFMIDKWNFLIRGQIRLLDFDLLYMHLTITN